MKSLTVSFRVKVEAVDLVRTCISSFLDHIVLNEPGTLLYKSLQSESDCQDFLHVMTFESEVAEQLHKQSDACKEFVNALYPLCESEPVFLAQNEIFPSTLL